MVATSDAFDRIRIILCQTSHPGNIGATARAMKTMGIHRLYLVNPKNFRTLKRLQCHLALMMFYNMRSSFKI